MSDDVIRFKITGLTFVDTIEAGSQICKSLEEGVEVYLDYTRQPDNKHDSNAIRIYYHGEEFGYLPKDIAAELAGYIDSGKVDIRIKVVECGWYEEKATYYCVADLELVI